MQQGDSLGSTKIKFSSFRRFLVAMHTFPFQAQCRNLHSSESYQESQVRGHELRQDTDYEENLEKRDMQEPKALKETKNIRNAREGGVKFLGGGVKLGSKTWWPKQTDVSPSPTHQDKQHAPKHASEKFSSLDFLGISPKIGGLLNPKTFVILPSKFLACQTHSEVLKHVLEKRLR